MAHADWQMFYRVQDALDVRSNGSVDAAEDALGLTLPPGYRELMTELGVGVISGVLRVYAPERLAQSRRSTSS